MALCIDDPLLKNRSHPGSMENQESHLFFRESCNYEATELISASLFLFISNTLSLHLSLSAQSNNGTSREQESPYSQLPIVYRSSQEVMHVAI